MRTSIISLVSAFLMLAVVLCLIPNHAQAQRDGLGVGLVVGDPTGLSLKKFITGSAALQMGITGSASGRNWGVPLSGSSSSFLYLQLDYIYHVYLTSGRTGLQIPFYIGLGGFNIFRTNPTGGFRLPLGLALHLGNIPIDIFFEVTPGIAIYPEVQPYTGIALGGRFYF